MRIDNLSQSTVARQNARIAAVERQAPLGNTSITTGRLRVVGLEAFLLEGTGRVSGTLYVDGPQGGAVDITGTLRGDGTIDWEGPVQLKGKVDVTGRMHVMGGGRVVSSDAGDVNYSMQMFYRDGTGNVIAFGVPMVIQAWSSILELNEKNLRISTLGNASVQLNENGLRIEAGGNSITMSEDSIQIVGDDGAAGAWIELKDGDIFFRNVPNS